MNHMIQTLQTLWHYAKAQRLQQKILYVPTRSSLEQYQQTALEHFAQRVLVQSPYFKPYAHLPIAQWPLMDKTLMMNEFDRMNTAALKQDELFACALRAETTRDFKPLLGTYSVGLSSGTSGRRGLFVVSAAERVQWSAAILTKLLPRGLLYGERVALFLRADNQLYQDVNNRWLSLAFFDLFSNIDQQCEQLKKYQPTIIVAPAQVLKELAVRKNMGELCIDPVLVLSVAEVLTPQDKALLQQTFKKVGEVYQATEGFLGATCSQGTLHLNEEYVYIEPQWLDRERFVPVVTDFTRQTQPIVRYRLDDVLVLKRTPCACGSVAMALERIEGRCDDQLQLPSTRSKIQQVTVFADVCHRALACVLPLQSDYQLTQHGKETLILNAQVSFEILQACQQELNQLFAQQGVAIKHLQWQLENTQLAIDFSCKRRRIVRIQ